MKAALADMLSRLPGPVTPGCPDGERFAQAFHHGSMSVELYAPPCATREAVGAGDVLFVPAGQPHHLDDFSDDFATWVVFYGPAGGEDP
jgi:hypothetical protein